MGLCHIWVLGAHESHVVSQSFYGLSDFRQKIWQDYQRRKAEQDALESSGASTSAAAPATPQSSRTLPRSQQQRNHSQPPQRPKSQVIGGKGLSKWISRLWRMSIVGR